MSNVVQRGATLESKVVVVTGSTRGIGRAIAERCAVAGARVVVTGRTRQRGEELAACINQQEGQAIFVPTDVTVETDVVRMFEVALEKWGRVDGIVGNAATLDLQRLDGPVTEVALESWHRIIDADLTSAFLTAKHGLKAIMRGERGGAMVLMGSLAGIRGNLGQDAYTTAKGGMLALSRAIAVYYARYAIRCNCLNLGMVDSGADRVGRLLAAPGFRDDLLKFQLGQLGQTSDVAGIASFLLSDEAKFINGAEIAVDGGASAASHMPRPFTGNIAGFKPIVGGTQ
jgi:NAD(P)-dependent dehydrogenase (short-subunit alcohol dehydrogenase family)